MHDELVRLGYPNLRNSIYDARERQLIYGEIARLRCLAKLQAGINIGLIAILTVLVIKVL